MCGRYVRRGSKQKIAGFFRANPQPAELPMPDADFNVAPTTYQPIIRESRETGERELVLARWGLVPFFTKDLKALKSLSTINARSDTIMTSPTWREPFKKRRCLIPASSFYEWPKEGKPPKQPYSFRTTNWKRLRICGIVGRVEGQGRSLAAVVRDCHNGSQRASCLDTSARAGDPASEGLRPMARPGETEQLPLDLLRPFDSDAMEMHEADPRVGNVRNNGPELMRKAEKATEDGELPL